MFLHPSTRRYFGGVKASDQLPVKAQHRCYIVNLDKSTSSGSHWVALYFSSDGKGEYFDSFGLPPMLPSIISFLNANSLSYSFNTKRLQHLRTAVCGQYCVYYLILRCSNMPMLRIVSYFNPNDFLNNDRYVLNFIKRVMSMYLPLYKPIDK